MAKHLIIGAGEVGRALFDILSRGYDVKIRDVDGHSPEHFDILHIAYPPIKNFLPITLKYIKSYTPRLIIVHSTVPVGTVRKLGGEAVHSPIFGPHKKEHNPGILPGEKNILPKSKGSSFGKNIGYFVKYFGGKKAQEAALIFSGLGIKTRVFKKPETTELLKILDTTYFSWNVVFGKEVKRICDKFGLDYEEVYTIPNKDYNEGYKKLGMPHVVRPVLKFMPGKIGGHCLIQNCELLDDWLTKIIRNRNKKY